MAAKTTYKNTGRGRNSREEQKPRRIVPLRYKWAAFAVVVLVIAAHMYVGGPVLLWAALPVLAAVGIAVRLTFRTCWRLVDKWGAREVHGLASWWEIHRKLSAAAVRRGAKHTHPHLDRPRAGHINGIGVPIGRHRGRRIVGSVEDFFLMIAPPRAIKSLWMAAIIMRWAGPAFVTSTRIDLIRHTIIGRAASGGRVWTINPDGYGGLGSTLPWSPLGGCKNPTIAMQRAGHLSAASSGGKGSENATFFAAGAYDILRLVMHAAAVSDLPITTAALWAKNPYLPEAAAAFRHPDIADGWAEEFTALLAGHRQTVMVFAQHAAECLEWLSDPQVAKIAGGKPSENLDLEAFLDSNDTIYMVGPKRVRGSLAPLIACLGGALYETAKLVASRQPGDRLRRKLLMALDEANITIPVDLPAMSSEAGGWGVTVVANVHTPEGLKEQWGERGAQIILDNAAWVILGPGVTNPAMLEQAAQTAGSHARAGEKHDPGGRVLSPSRIRMTQAPYGTVLHRNARPLVVRLDRVIKLRGYAKATGFEFDTTPEDSADDLATVTELAPAAA